MCRRTLSTTLRFVTFCELILKGRGLSGIPEGVQILTLSGKACDWLLSWTLLNTPNLIRKLLTQKMAALHNVQWLTSNKGQPLLVIDDYIFKDAGKGKSQHAPNVRYWVCKQRCGVKAKTDGQNLITVEGIVNRPDHGHVSDSIEIKNRNLKVSDVILYFYIIVWLVI